MKYFFCLILIFGMNVLCFSQNKQNVEKDIKEIVNYLKNDDLISFYNKHQSYEQNLATYLKNGDTLRYKMLSDSSDYKYNNAMYKDNILRGFLDCKKDYTNESKKLRIDWSQVQLKQILIEDEVYLPNEDNKKEIFVSAKILVSGLRNSNDCIMNIGLNYSKSGLLTSFRILEEIHSGFSTIEKYLKFEKEEKEQRLENASQVSGGQNRLKAYAPSESDSKNQFQKTYVSEDGHSYKLILTFEKTNDNILLKSIKRIVNNDVKHSQSLNQLEIWNGIVVFNSYGSKNTWYVYENDKKMICFSIDAYIKDINKLEKITLRQTNNDDE